MPPTRIKARRITQACDFCHHRGLRCKPKSQELPSQSIDVKSCLTCVEYGQECTRVRQPKRRGTKPGGTAGTAAATGSFNPLSRLGNGPESTLKAVPGRHGSAVADRRLVTLLLDVYLDSIHPNFPLFCERELWVGWRDGTFPRDDSDYMSLMCLCALSAQHVGDGALFNDEIDANEQSSLRESILNEAHRLVPVHFEKCDLNLLRSYTLMALVGAQTGNNAMLHKFLGLCHGVSAHLNLQDEFCWPASITTCDQEVRRRLWWSIYRLEVHTACVLGNVVRTSETDCDVGYPVGTHHPPFLAGRNGQYEDWFDGWNTTADLYRILEHALSDLRARNRNNRSILGTTKRTDSTAIMTRLAQVLDRLLPQFLTPASRSDDSGRNRCGFQAPNIICTVHLARLLSCVSDGDFPLACKVAADLVSSIMSVPHEYVRATGSPLIQQLAGVGHLLIGIAKRNQLSKAQFNEVNRVVGSLLTILEPLSRQSDIASNIRTRLTTLLTDLQEGYEVAPETTARDIVPTVEDEPQWYTDGAVDLSSDCMAQPLFPTNLLTDFTWLYPSYP